MRATDTKATIVVRVERDIRCGQCRCPAPLDNCGQPAGAYVKTALLRPHDDACRQLVQRDVDGALQGVAGVVGGADAVPGGGAAHVSAARRHYVEAALEPAPEVAGADDEAVDDGDVGVVEVPHAADRRERLDEDVGGVGEAVAELRAELQAAERDVLPGYEGAGRVGEGVLAFLHVGELRASA